MSLSIRIIFLVIISRVTPMAFGYDVETKERDEFLEKLAFICFDKYGSSKLAYHK